MDSFSNTLNRFKSLTFATVRGAFAPRTPCGGRVIAFWRPSVPPRTKFLPTPLIILLLYYAHTHWCCSKLMQSFSAIWSAISISEFQLFGLILLMPISKFVFQLLKSDFCGKYKIQTSSFKILNYFLFN